jgi:WD40 repeat protein
MFSSTNAAFAVNFSARSLCARPVQDTSEFLVGTCSSQDCNELTVLNYSEEANDLDAKAIYNHRDEVWAMDMPRVDGMDDLVLTSGREASSGKTSLRLWRMGGLKDLNNSSSSSDGNGINNDDGDNMNTVETGGDDVGTYFGDDLLLVADCEFDESKKNEKFTSFVSSIRWAPPSIGSRIATKDPQYLRIWSVDTTTKIMKEESKIELVTDGAGGSGLSRFSGEWSGGGVSWSSDNNTVGVVTQSQLQIIDIRSSKNTIHIKNVHQGETTDCDFNPNRSNFIVTTGQDRFTKIWDIRTSKQPLTKVLTGHGHWVQSARYHPIHDQLIATGGTDNVVNMWRVASCGSTAWVGGEIDGDGEEPDVNAKRIDQHEDSIYSLAWGASTVNPWILCSLSYDGRVVLSHVPSAEKYKILL